MGKTYLEFDFVGSRSKFIQKIRGWLKSTKEGKTYKVENRDLSGSGYVIRSFMELIIIKFQIKQEINKILKISVTGFVKGSHPLSWLLLPLLLVGGILPHGKLSFQSDKFKRPSQKQGWRDLQSLLSYLGIKSHKVH